MIKVGDRIGKLEVLALGSRRRSSKYDRRGWTNNPSATVRCECGTVYETFIHNLKKAQQCAPCARRLKRPTPLRVQPGETSPTGLLCLARRSIDKGEFAHGAARLSVRCDAGHETEVRADQFKSSGCSVCRRLSSHPEPGAPMPGTALVYSEDLGIRHDTAGRPNSFALFLCQCGKTREIRVIDVKTKRITSCASCSGRYSAFEHDIFATVAAIYPDTVSRDRTALGGSGRTRLELDVYNAGLVRALEADGPHHYSASRHSGRTEEDKRRSLDATTARDRRKDAQAAAQGISLGRIRYDVYAARPEWVRLWCAAWFQFADPVLRKAVEDRIAKRGR